MRRQLIIALLAFGVLSSPALSADPLVARQSGDGFQGTYNVPWISPLISGDLKGLSYGDAQEAHIAYDAVVGDLYLYSPEASFYLGDISTSGHTHAEYVYSGTANQIVKTGTTFSLANPLMAPGPVTATGDLRAYNGNSGISIWDQFCATPPVTNSTEIGIWQTGNGVFPMDDYRNLAFQARSQVNSEAGIVFFAASDSSDGLTRDGTPIARMMITGRRRLAPSVPVYGNGSIIGLKGTTKTFEFDSNGNLWTLGDVTVGDDLNITGDNINITGNSTVDLAGPSSSGTLQLGDSDGNDIIDIPYAQIDELQLGTDGSYIGFESTGTTFVPRTASDAVANLQGASIIAPVHYVNLNAEALLYYGQIAKPSNNLKFGLNDASGKKAIGIASTVGTTWQTTVGSDWPLAISGRCHVAPAEDITPIFGYHAFQSATAGYANFQDDPPLDGTGIGTVIAANPIRTISHLTGVNTTTETITISGAIAVNLPVVYWNSGGTSIGGLVDGAVYWIKTSNDTFFVTLSKTRGGATVDLTSSGTDSTQYLMALPEIMLQWE